MGMDLGRLTELLNKAVEGFKKIEKEKERIDALYNWINAIGPAMRVEVLKLSGFESHAAEYYRNERFTRNSPELRDLAQKLELLD